MSWMVEAAFIRIGACGGSVKCVCIRRKDIRILPHRKFDHNQQFI